MNYEISLWGTKNIVDKSGTTILNEYTKEIQYAILGRNDSTSPIAAYNPQLTLKINGEKSLTFQMPDKYYDRSTGQYEDNPFVTRPTSLTAPILVNGRIIKFKTDEGFDTFIINDISKDSNSGIYTFTCNDANIMQLSKTGYDITLDTELENNMGTIFDLASSVVEDIDWHVVDTTGHTLSDGTTIKSDLIHAYSNEALYSYTLSSATSAKNILTNDLITIAAGQTVFVSAQSYENDYAQWIIVYRGDGEYQVNEDRVITNAANYLITNPNPASTLYVSQSYRGRILQNYPISKYIPNIEMTCNLYTDANDIEYYGYSENEYLTSASISDLISENTDIINVEDWTGAEIKVNTTSGQLGTEYVALTFPAAPNNYIYSTTINSCKAAFATTKGFNTQERYVLVYNKLGGYNFTDVKVQARSNNANDTNVFTDYYIVDSNGLPSGKSYPTDLANYQKVFLKGTRDLSYTAVANSYVRLTLTGTGVTTLDDIKLFPERYDENGQLVVPNLAKVESSVIRTRNYYFTAAQIDDTITSVDDLTYSDILYDTDSGNDNYTQVMNNYELVTSIEAKESNRFNIIQDLCEKFECWSHIYLDCDTQGRVRYKYIPVTNSEKYIAGKQYFILQAGKTAQSWFGDENYQYADLSECFTSVATLADHHYQYTNRNKYYTKIGDTYVPANLGHQWAEYTYNSSTGIYDRVVYYMLSYTTTEDEGKTKTWTAVDYTSTSYSAAQQYYIQTSTVVSGQTIIDYTEVTVSNDTITNFYVIKDTWRAGLYVKQYERYITFNEYTGKDNMAGIKYGINLNNITRTLNSDNLVTKLIVGQNSNEYAANKMCTIADASQNTSGSSTLYDFNYYITYGLIDEEQYTNDMYGGEDGGFNYLGKYAEINTASKANINLLTELQVAVTKLNSQYSVYTNALAQAQQSYLDTIADIQDLSDDIGTRWSWSAATTNKQNSSLYPDNLNELIQARDTYQANIDKYNKLVDNMSGEVETQNSKLNLILKEQENYTNLKEALDKEFYNKYKDYIREGTWISEDYYDPDEYYLDASNILVTSAFPEVSYTFSVVDLSDLEGWKDYKFGIGDKTYVRDTEFFKDQGIKQLEVIISSITYNFDEPQNTSITVQNYATRFEDLFQRVAAATQQLSYNEGKYEQAGTLATNSTVGSALISQMLSENNNIITAADGQFTYDTNGITAIDKNTNYQVRLTTHGLVLTKDGGETWTTGVSAKGINTDILTAGTINADKVQIYGGTRNQRFIWDKYGINAFTGITNSNKNKYVRFDKFGVYGVEGEAYSWQPSSASDLFSNDNVQFSVNWLGMKSASATTSNFISIRTDSGNTDKGTVRSYAYKLYTGTFSITGTYYELGSDGYYFVTSDTERQSGKDYYILTRESDNEYRKIINAGIVSKNDGSIVKTTNFALFEDGTILANNGQFNGVITCQDLRDASGTSMLSNGKIQSQYLDVNLAGIEIDSTHIKLKPTSGSSSDAYVEITNDSVKISNGTLITDKIESQDLEIHYEDEYTSYTQLIFTEDKEAGEYGIVGGHYAPDIVGLGETPDVVSGIVIAKNNLMTEEYDSRSGGYIFASEGGVALRHSLYALEVCASGVFVTHQGNRFQLTSNGSGGSSGSTTTVVAVFG